MSQNNEYEWVLVKKHNSNNNGGGDGGNGCLMIFFIAAAIFYIISELIKWVVENANTIAKVGVLIVVSILGIALLVAFYRSKMGGLMFSVFIVVIVGGVVGLGLYLFSDNASTLIEKQSAKQDLPNEPKYTDKQATTQNQAKTKADDKKQIQPLALPQCDNANLLSHLNKKQKDSLYQSLARKPEDWHKIQAISKSNGVLFADIKTYIDRVKINFVSVKTLSSDENNAKVFCQAEAIISYPHTPNTARYLLNYNAQTIANGSVGFEFVGAKRQ